MLQTGYQLISAIFTLETAQTSKKKAVRNVSDGREKEGEWAGKKLLSLSIIFRTV
jgi:hypothetical protein